MSKKVYVVYSFGGQYEDKWDHLELAFLSRKVAEEWIEKEEAKKNAISDEKYQEIQEWWSVKEYEISDAFYDDSNQLRPGKTEEEYCKVIDVFYDDRYGMAAKQFNVDEEDLRDKEHDVTYDFVGYHCKEIDLNDEIPEEEVEEETEGPLKK